MVNVAICDDEKPVQENMAKLIASYLRKKSLEYEISTFGDGEDLLEFCKEPRQPLIVFLDINMDKIDGIEAAKKIREISSEIYIVFVTAYIKYSIEGYKFRAIRYLIKGDKNFGLMLEECIDTILGDLSYGLNTMEFDFREGKREISLADILYIESRLHNVYFFVCNCKKSKYSMAATLDEVEEVLEGLGFLRIHQSFLLNLEHLKELRAYTAELDNGSELPIPRTRYRAVKEAFVEYKGEL